MKKSYSIKELSLETGCPENKIEKIIFAYSGFFKKADETVNTPSENQNEKKYSNDSLNKLKQIFELAESGKSAVEIREILETGIKEDTGTTSDDFAKSDDYRMLSEKIHENRTDNKNIEYGSVAGLLRIIADQKLVLDSLNEKVSTLENKLKEVEKQTLNYDDMESRILLKVNDVLSELFYKKT